MALEVLDHFSCLEDAETLDNTIVDMFASLGAGGAALADREQVLSMAEDISSATTQSELMNALLGDPSKDFLNIVETIINYEFVLSNCYTKQCCPNQIVQLIS